MLGNPTMHSPSMVYSRLHLIGRSIRKLSLYIFRPPSVPVDRADSHRATHPSKDLVDVKADT